jgi:YidC/Oxa1 family membrane protein insertase
LDTSRLIIAIILSLGLVFAYQELVLKRLYPPTEHGPAEKAKPVTPTTSPLAVPSAAAPVQQAAPQATVGALVAAAGGPEKLVIVDTDLYRATFTTKGARLKSFELKRYRETASRGSPWYEMVRPSESGRLPLGVFVEANDTIEDDHLLNYTTDSPARIELSDGEKATITFRARAADGLQLEKSIVLEGDRYPLTMTVKASGAQPIEGLGIAMTQPLTEHGQGYYNIPELQAEVQDKTTTAEQKALKKGVKPVSGKITYAGVGDRYFLAVYLPESPHAGTLTMALVGDDASSRILFRGTSHVRTEVYLGPKDLNLLDAVNPALHKAIDFGWAGFLALPFLRVLKLFHRFAPNWGWDIILLTVGLRILTLPMSIKSQRSMLRMQKLQPQMERIRAQFKDNPERINREMVDLYKRNHVNPLGGCAPMAIQLPIFLALYEALLSAVELRHAAFLWWIKDLSAPDCFPVAWMPQLPLMHCRGIPVLVLLMGLSTYVQQWMSPTSPDPNQQRMMMLTPIIFTVMLVNFPAGLSLYYFASNVLGIIQQYFLNREFKQSVPVT